MARGRFLCVTGIGKTTRYWQTSRGEARCFVPPPLSFFLPSLFAPAAAGRLPGRALFGDEGEASRH